MTAPNLNIFYADLILDYLVRCGVETCFVSPGSRSTALIAAAAGRADISVRMHIDERASAFMAVGFARATGSIPALICTSGTAVANYLPAVVEAFQSRLPLVLLTADRPEELQDCGANQTIDQHALYGRFALESITLGTFDADTDPDDVLKTLDKAACLIDEGPIHINCRFRKPLDPVAKAFDLASLSGRKDAFYKNSPIGLKPKDPLIDFSQAVEEVAGLINGSESGLIIAGPEAPYRTCQNLDKLAKVLDWPIIADIHSQYRFGSKTVNAIGHFDLLNDAEIPDFPTPRTILHVGGLPTSKSLIKYLLGLKGMEYIKIQDHEQTIDPDRLETERLTGDPDKIIDLLITKLTSKEKTSGWKKLRATDLECARFLSEHFDDKRLTEPSLAYGLGKLIRDGDGLYLSSSMPIRDAESFMSVRTDSLMVGANRGASGIDGLIASACGFAFGSGKPTTLLLGDLTFIHDLNSLALVKKSEIPIIVVVVNNRGGGIFHFLPIAAFEDIFEPYFGTPHDLTFDSAAKMFDLPYYQPKTIPEFESSYNEARDNNRSAIIEISTDRNQNVAEHETIRSRLAAVLSRKDSE
ncbi:MAG: 2-succinyl-5-enolpyruvyl-6-hydroxy-3-cyclohexene-1-carboxylic-acid synthase [FCB group bacterium]|nr:2-succinyl-5-enolpyruvyl-6-hydroxy-3-cyclohexene-1-carboxylic-acid synthase [FCB group bacterium]